jgi:hypothetical protein
MPSCVPRFFKITSTGYLNWSLTGLLPIKSGEVNLMKNALAQDSEDWTDELDEPEDIQRVLTWLEEASNHEKDLCLVLEGSL